MRFGIVGARLSGSYLGLLLAGLGHDVIMFDGSVGGEKPCGGGVTPKALRTMSWFKTNNLPHTVIDTLQFVTRDGRTSEMSLRKPMHIFSRSLLDMALRRDAVAAGCSFIPQKALRFTSRSPAGWLVHTASAAHEIDFLVGADGVTSTVRRTVSSGFRAEDLSLALGYYIPGCHHRNSVMTAFQEPGFQGYLWSFPRVDHSSVGILRWLPAANAADLRTRLRGYIGAAYPEAAGQGRFYAACIPCMDRRHLNEQHVCGPTWALVGDAAGFADPITGEGIYYALRSAELLAEAVGSGDPAAYESRWRRDFGHELVRAAELRERFYCGRLFGRSAAERAVHLAGRSLTAAGLVEQVIDGECTYDLMLRNLLVSSPRILWDTLVHRLH